MRASPLPRGGFRCMAIGGRIPVFPCDHHARCSLGPTMCPDQPRDPVNPIGPRRCACCHFKARLVDCRATCSPASDSQGDIESLTEPTTPQARKTCSVLNLLHLFLCLAGSVSRSHHSHTPTLTASPFELRNARSKQAASHCHIEAYVVSPPSLSVISRLIKATGCPAAISRLSKPKSFTVSPRQAQASLAPWTPSCTLLIRMNRPKQGPSPCLRETNVTSRRSTCPADVALTPGPTTLAARPPSARHPPYIDRLANSTTWIGPKPTPLRESNNHEPILNLDSTPLFLKCGHSAHNS